MLDPPLRLIGGQRLMHERPSLFPSILQAILLLIASWLFQYVVTLGLYDMREALGLDKEQIVALAMLLSYGILIATIGHFMRLRFGQLLHPNASSVFSTFWLLVPPTLLLVPLLILLDMALIEGLEQFFPISGWERDSFNLMRSASLPMLVAVCVLAPLFEEILFRGILLRGFLQRYPRHLAIAYSALLFGIAHLNIYQFLLAFFLGLLLGWLYERSHSLIPGIALHAAINTSVTLLSSGANNASATGGSVFDVPALVWLLALVLAAVGAWVLRYTLWRKSDPPPLQET